MIELNTLDDTVDGHQPRISYSCSCRKRSIVRTVLFVLTLLFIYDISLKLGLHFHVLVKIMRSQLTITKTTQHKHTKKKQYPLFLTGKSCPEQPDNAANVFHRQGCNSQRRKQYHTLVQPSLYLHRQSLPQQLWQPSYYQK